MSAPERHVREGPIELLQDDPVGFRVIRSWDGRDVVVQIWALGQQIYETWIDPATGQKMGRWTWRYL